MSYTKRKSKGKSIAKYNYVRSVDSLECAGSHGDDVSLPLGAVDRTAVAN